MGLVGFVGNDADGVFIETEGPASDVERFIDRLMDQLPPLARVESVAQGPMPTRDLDRGFVIVDSQDSGRAPSTMIPPDVGVCADCVDEMDDPSDRRYRYPFINCTNCGPRFSIISGLPYDRPSTTMADFELCDPCAVEYHDPTDRRFHAQPIACPTCGPQLRYRRVATRSTAGPNASQTAAPPPPITPGPDQVVGHDLIGNTIDGADAVVVATQRALAAGEIVAVKGLGGYHLACDAASDTAVERLRARKGRGAKPFAVMVADLRSAAELADISPVEATALTSTEAPIVLLRARSESPLSPLVAPGNPLIGVMMAYTPLHHLLFRPVPGGNQVSPDALVMTSGNLADEPICFDDAEAETRLSSLADAFCTHDRPIQVPCDDSVVRVVDEIVQPIRRSRGFAPLPVRLPIEVEATLAVGGELKNTFCVASGRHAWISQHIGDMAGLETLHAFEATVGGFLRMYGIEPTVVATDCHPGYLTRRWAHERETAMKVVEVQHHHAHVAAIMAEHGLDGTRPVIGVAFDGTGYGTDATGSTEIWGGEVLLADYTDFERVGHLRSLPLPGGDEAVRNPCRMAVAYLTALGHALDPTIPAVAACDEVERSVVARLVERSVGCVPTTSMGRLFDVVASFLGVCHRAGYEAQAAIELEAAATTGEIDRWPLAFTVDCRGVIDPGPVVAGLLRGLGEGVDTADLALAFHQAVAAAIVDSVRPVSERTGITTVALTGGVFQNALLAVGARRALEDQGFDVLTHRLVPANDAGLSLGQAVIVGSRRRVESSSERS